MGLGPPSVISTQTFQSIGSFAGAFIQDSGTDRNLWYSHPAVPRRIDVWHHTVMTNTVSSKLREDLLVSHKGTERR